MLVVKVLCAHVSYFILNLCVFFFFSDRVTSLNVPCYMEEPIVFSDALNPVLEGFIYIGAEIELRDPFYSQATLSMHQLPIVHPWPEEFVQAYNYILERFHDASAHGPNLLVELERILNDLNCDDFLRAFEDADFGYLADLNVAALDSHAANSVIEPIIEAEVNVSGNNPNVDLAVAALDLDDTMDYTVGPLELDEFIDEIINRELNATVEPLTFDDLL